MQYAIIVSEKDPAGLNIKECLMDLYYFEEKDTFDGNPVYAYEDSAKLYTLKGDTIHAEDLDKQIEADFFIFATKHASKEEVQSLSCHFPGNWNKAEFGGKDKTLSKTSARALKSAFLELQIFQGSVLDHQITLEATHHGPYLDKPCMFVEIGSNEEQWKHRKAGQAVAHSIITVIDRTISEPQRIAIGLGGGHYAPSFNKILEKTDIAISHICPKFNLEFLDEEMLQQAIDKTQEKVDFILLDWKGLGQEKDRIVNLLEKMNLKYERTDKLS